MRDFHPDDDFASPEEYTPQSSPDDFDPGLPNQLLDFVLRSEPAEVVDTDLFAVMKKRRSTRKFSDKPVETVKIDKIIAAADTAPTAGNFQGFEIFYVKSPEKKRLLVDACNFQSCVDAPIVLVFCKNPSRVKFNFPPYVLRKFAIQDATLAAGYSQLAAQALGLSSIWIGMFDEQKIMDILQTDLVPSSLLCIGYPKQTKFPKPRRNLKDLVNVVW
ncbi:MAG: nitroreductase family protein [Nitrosopumilus sp.]|jgi:nitroreductase|nr:nitroreductase family protein [Nitrosopumilus sp.]MDC0209198.1 nitroreductase family protein [Nitrosopumilus sp.]MDC0228433.1 nitroreductase family protein [Nitrosopumilus sp.]MDC0388272.1 nitroreductase family protein [Nitrosopumilus sp.]|tara:strand:+ start:2115 stop:2765 length:651 start_codon:yes stop_codon:yes gene_type:complete